MEEVRKAAIIYYNNSPIDVKATADKFFDLLDINKDGQISFYEFSSLLREFEGFDNINNPSFFNEISSQGSNELSKEDVITLYYISQSCRPLCDGCGRLIKGMYFTCDTCFKTDDSNTFDLHPDCYAKGHFIHKHTSFIDNFTMLAHSRMKRVANNKTARLADNKTVRFAAEAFAGAPHKPQTATNLEVRQSSNSQAIALAYPSRHEVSQSSNSRAIALADPSRHWKRRAAFAAVLSAGASYCTQM